VAMVNKVWGCPAEYVLESARWRWPMPKWYLEIICPPSVYAAVPYYNRQVCIWKPEYYDIPIIQKGINILISWVKFEWGDLEIKPGIDRKSAGWIGFRTWIQTHPVYSDFPHCHCSRGSCSLLHGSYFRTPNGNLNKNNRSMSRLTGHWFKYELAQAYPTLYGEGGWAHKLKK